MTERFIDFIAAVDVGSTKVAPVFFDPRTGQDRALSNYLSEDCFWTRWTDIQKIYPEWGCKIVKLDDLEEICEPQLKRAAEKAGIFNWQASVSYDMVVTSCTNNLALTYKDKTVIILDEPSLAPGELSNQQEEILKRYGLDPNNLKPTSSLAKLIRVINDAGFVKWLGNEFYDCQNLTLDQFQFNTLLGVLADTDQVPTADWYGFSTNRGLSIKQTENLLRELTAPAGIREIKFADPGQEETGTKILLKNDFIAEGQYLDLIAWFLAQNYPWIREASFISTDSVIKLIWLKDHPEIAKKRAGEAATDSEWSYATQRIGGNVYRHLFRLIALIRPSPELEGGQIYRAIDRVIKDQLHAPVSENPFVFYPDEVDGDLGGLFYRNYRAKLRRINIDSFIAKFPEDPDYTQYQTVKKIIQTMAQGVYWGVREKLEKMRGAEDQKPVVFFGGMTQNGGWSKLMAQCLGVGHPVWFLKMRSAAEAAAVVAAFECEINISGARLPALYRHTTEGYWDNEYLKWLELRRQVEVNS